MSADQATAIAIAFTDTDLPRWLAQASDADLDTLDFGTIGIDAAGVVCRYNRFESVAAGLSPSRVLGHPLFTVVAPCMNNFLVAQRFEDAATHGSTLDATIDYVLTGEGEVAFAGHPRRGHPLGAGAPPRLSGNPPCFRPLTKNTRRCSSSSTWPRSVSCKRDWTVRS